MTQSILGSHFFHPVSWDLCMYLLLLLSPLKLLGFFGQFQLNLIGRNLKDILYLHILWKRWPLLLKDFTTVPASKRAAIWAFYCTAECIFDHESQTQRKSNFCYVWCLHSALKPTRITCVTRWAQILKFHHCTSIFHVFIGACCSIFIYNYHIKKVRCLRYNTTFIL